MKKLLAVLLCAALLLTCTAFAEEAAAPALTRDLMILFTSDAHCGISSGFGYAGVAAVRDALAADNHVILVDDGDAIQGEPIGTMTTGEALVKLMNTAGYEVAIPGNHEFDYGMDRFLELTKVAEYPYVSCNFTYMGEKVFPAYVMKEYDGVKVAFIGVTTPKTFTSSTPTYFQDGEGNYVYGFCEDDTGAALYAAVQEAADAARAEGAQYVVVQAHLGIEDSCSPWMSTEVIANTAGIDALLDGHSHSELSSEKVLNKDGEEVLLVACGTKLANIGWLKIGKDGKLSSGLYSWKYNVSFPAIVGDTEMAKAVAEASDVLNEKLSEVVASTEVDLITHDPATEVRLIRCAETNLGDLCADAYRVMGNADIGLVNGGGIRVKISAGDITLNDILKVHPFGNAMCVVEATGAQILNALEWNSRKVPGETGGFLQVSGLTYEIHSYIESSVTNDDKGNFTGVTGEYRVKNVMVNGEPLDPEKIYTVASHNYMLKNGGDGTNMFQQCNILVDEAMLDNQVLINYITTTLGGVVGEEYAELFGQGRIVIVNEAP